MAADPGAGLALHFHGADLIARPSGALWWPDRLLLVVADLHLGRSERYARRGGPLLPPFEVTDTLDRLAAEIAALDPARVLSLGDGFDDDGAAAALPDAAQARLHHMARGRDWIWLAGNHDPAPAGTALPGRSLPDWQDSAGPVFRHAAGRGPDVSGHLHPVLPLAGRRWRCFAQGRDHLILPAFGTYTGGLDLADPAFAALAGGVALCCAPRMFRAPIPAR